MKATVPNYRINLLKMALTLLGCYFTCQRRPTDTKAWIVEVNDDEVKAVQLLIEASKW